ncbi:hypothetical protein ACTI_02570 [Actinoplanes sp. OR16]|nr:hypothetical protein ACTI_02570 [Actinoplanes sp. OR16]
MSLGLLVLGMVVLGMVVRGSLFPGSLFLGVVVLGSLVRGSLVLGSGVGRGVVGLGFLLVLAGRSVVLGLSLVGPCRERPVSPGKRGRVRWPLVPLLDRSTLGRCRLGRCRSGRCLLDRCRLGRPGSADLGKGPGKRWGRGLPGLSCPPVLVVVGLLCRGRGRVWCPAFRGRACRGTLDRGRAVRGRACLDTWDPGRAVRGRAVLGLAVLVGVFRLRGMLLRFRAVGAECAVRRPVCGLCRLGCGGLGLEFGLLRLLGRHAIGSGRMRRGPVSIRRYTSPGPFRVASTALLTWWTRPFIRPGPSRGGPVLRRSIRPYINLGLFLVISTVLSRLVVEGGGHGPRTRDIPRNRPGVTAALPGPVLLLRRIRGIGPGMLPLRRRRLGGMGADLPVRTPARTLSSTRVRTVVPTGS